MAKDLTDIIKTFVLPPDHSAIRDEIEEHTGFVRITDRKLPSESCWAKVLFTNNETVILQRVEMRVNRTRFCVHQIALPEWNRWFVAWIDEGDHAYEGAMDCWQQGYLMYV